MCQEVAAEADAVLARAARALATVQRYEGCRALIQQVQREAMRSLYAGGRS